MSQDFKYDLAVAWRIYPKISKTPLYYRDDKFNLVKLSLVSFLKSATGVRVKYYFILDGCPVEYEELINELFAGHDFDIIKTNAVGNLKTFEKQVHILSSQTASNLAYFAEDDYLYIPNALHKMLRFYNQHKDVDFVTGYHHFDTTHLLIHKVKKKYIEFEDIRWQTDISTCLTFLTSRTVLNKSKNIFLTYGKGNNDCSIWLILTKSHIYNPFKYILFWSARNDAFNILKVAIKYGFRYFFHLKKYTLWTAVPAICTHLERGLESPEVDWDAVYKQIKMEMQ